ncbi:hypothetical protein RGAI101_1527 [Roseobacter sp. GAI101]|nr:hypothetical protein RGAI101_1527 [Roseobacter sp. GAI101]
MGQSYPNGKRITAPLRTTLWRGLLMWSAPLPPLPLIFAGWLVLIARTLALI